jgi:hypothetical protein
MKKLLASLALTAGVCFPQTAGLPVSTVTVASDTALPNGAKVGDTCSNYNVQYLNGTNGHLIACVNSANLSITNKGVWTITNTGGGGGGGVSAPGSTNVIMKYLGSNLTDAATANDITPLFGSRPAGCVLGGNNTCFVPSITGPGVSGTWPNLSITGGGGGGASLPTTSLLLKGDNAGGATTATAPDVTSLFSGTGTFLKSDGTRGTPTGGASLPTTTVVLKGDNAGGALAATPGTDYLAPASNLDATKLVNTVPAAALPVAGAALGAVKSNACGAGTHSDGTFSVAGVPGCSADTGGSATIPSGTTANVATYTSNTVGALGYATDAPGSQLPFYVRPSVGGAPTPFLTVGASGLLQITGGNVIDGVTSKIVTKDGSNTLTGSYDFTGATVTGVGGSGSIASTSAPLKGNGSGGAVAATSADVAGLFSGTGTFLKSDGTQGNQSTVATSVNSGTSFITATTTNTGDTVFDWTNTNAASGGIHNYRWDAFPGAMQFLDTTGGAALQNFFVGARLEIDAGLRVNANGNTKPTCAVGIRGTFWYVAAGAGVKDDVQVCAKAADDSYSWRVIY